MSKPFVSVLIDTYNHEDFIEQAIKSVLEQDFPASESEILVVDDGSTDRTAEIVRRFAPRVQVLRKNNGGQASAFNAGIPETQGEVVAFLDGDDWWAREKLTTVAEVFRADPAVGLVGHGISDVYLDGRCVKQALREECRFRLNSPQEAKKFRMRRGFLGTSRMAYRKDILLRIGSVPEALRFEADEYLFTLAGLFADVVILREALTFYRLHDKNLFQISGRNTAAVRRKQQVLAALVRALEEAFERNRVSREISRVVLECVEIEADVLRLEMENAWPWETIAAELKILRIFHEDASRPQHLFSYARMLPALVLSSKNYYRSRRALSRLNFYQGIRRRFMPFPVPNDVERRET
jgi:glycosyltransferase involved in cell wall biosynthesis